MTITITIHTDSDSFVDDDDVTETMRVLDRCKDIINGEGLAVGDVKQLRDTNGNHCGAFHVKSSRRV